MYDNAKENNEKIDKIVKELEHNPELRKKNPFGFVPTYIIEKEEFKEDEKDIPYKRNTLHYGELRDTTDYENFDEETYSLVLELANFLPISNISEITQIDEEVIKVVLQRAEKKAVDVFEQPPIIIWLPRFMWRFVDFVALKYNPKWVEEAKRVFIQIIKKLRSRKFRT